MHGPGFRRKGRKHYSRTFCHALPGVTTGILRFRPQCTMWMRGRTGGSPPFRRRLDLTVANLITLLRFALVPAIVYAMVQGEMGWAMAGFIVAGISDGVDGFVARQFNQRSELGAYLDPLADKLLLVSVFAGLGLMGELPLWLVIMAVSRDGLIMGAVVLSTIMQNPVEMRPLFVSKANTAVQIVLAGLVLTELAFETSFGPARSWLVVLSALLTASSTAAYFVAWLKHMGGYATSD